MKLVILGATGGIGLELVKQAVKRGHSVTALVRAPERLEAFRDRITIVPGDLLNSTELTRVLNGHDAVLSSVRTAAATARRGDDCTAVPFNARPSDLARRPAPPLNFRTCPQPAWS